MRVVAIDQQTKMTEKRQLGLGADTMEGSNSNFKRQNQSQKVKQMISKAPSKKEPEEIIWFNSQGKGHKSIVCRKPKKGDDKKTNSNNTRGPKNNNAMKKGEDFRKNTQTTKEISTSDNMENYDDSPSFFGEEQDHEDERL